MIGPYVDPTISIADFHSVFVCCDFDDDDLLFNPRPTNQLSL
jgi:hypothetical protein